MNFDLREAPVLGDASNRRYIVSLFDYTCPDCHEMHALLPQLFGECLDF